MIQVSVIIVNYNTSNLTLNAIQSINEKFIKNNACEIIIVDNASEIEDFNTLEKGLNNFETYHIKLIKSKINVGFGAGNMIGVQNASGNFYVFMNSDVILIKDTFTEMIDFLNKNTNVSIVGCQAINENGEPYKAFDYNLSLKSELFSDTFLQFLFPKSFISRIVNTKEPIKVGAVPGSLFTCVAKDFKEVGGFDTSIFLYYEEKDLAFRIQKTLEKDIYSLPYLTYIHLKGKSTKPSQKIRNEMKISQFYVIQKNLSSIKYKIFYSSQFLIFLLKSLFSAKNRSYLFLLLNGISVAKSIKHSQKIIS